MNKLEQFKSKKAELVELLDETTGIFKELKDESEVQSLEEIRSKLKDNNFKVLVIGEFKRGKSTFINALLQEEILPAYSISKYRGYQCGAQYAEAFAQCMVYPKPTTRRLLP